MDYFSLILIVYAAVMVCVAALVSLVPEAKPWAVLAALVWPVALVVGPAVNLATALRRAGAPGVPDARPRLEAQHEIARLVDAARAWRKRGLAADRDPALAAVDLQLSAAWLMLARQYAIDYDWTPPEEFWIWTDAERLAHREKVRRAGWDTYNAEVLADVLAHDQLRAPKFSRGGVVSD